MPAPAEFGKVVMLKVVTGYWSCRLITTLYVGTYGGGVFKSTNFGASWSAINTGLIDTNVLRPGHRPTFATTLYAGTTAAACSRAPTVGGPGTRSTPA